MSNQIETNAAVAAMHLQARYRALSTYATKAAAIARKSGRAIPKDFIEAYARAFRDHLRFGNDLFFILRQRGVGVEQIVLHDGKPIPSKDNPLGVRTVKIDAPLHPPVLPGMNDRGEVMAGDEVGIAPLVIGAYVIGGIVFTAIAGYVSIKLLREIRIIMRGPDYEPDKQAEAILKTFAGLKAGGVTPDKAAEIAKGGTTAPAGTAAGSPPSAGISVGIVLIGAAALGGLLLFVKK